VVPDAAVMSVPVMLAPCVRGLLRFVVSELALALARPDAPAAIDLDRPGVRDIPPNSGSLGRTVGRSCSIVEAAAPGPR
jgi:hypothetical protein